MLARRIFRFFPLFVLALSAWLALWAAAWMEKRELPPSGGIFIPGEILIEGPHFLQADERWGQDKLGSTEDSLAKVGCAVTSSAMVLASYGMAIDPGKLNGFLAKIPGGYTPEGWIYWEKAAEADSRFTDKLLPHYEDGPSYFLIDWNLLNGNPVIIRLRYPSGVTHFMVICGKRGFDYLVRDPGAGGNRGVYPLKDFRAPMEALRFYRKPAAKDPKLSIASEQRNNDGENYSKNGKSQ